MRLNSYRGKCGNMLTIRIINGQINSRTNSFFGPSLPKSEISGVAGVVGSKVGPASSMGNDGGMASGCEEDGGGVTMNWIGFMYCWNLNCCKQTMDLSSKWEHRGKPTHFEWENTEKKVRMVFAWDEEEGDNKLDGFINKLPFIFVRFSVDYNCSFSAVLDSFFEECRK